MISRWIRTFLHWLLSFFEPKVDVSREEFKVEELKKKDAELKKQIKDGEYKTVEEAMEEWKL